MSRTDLCASCDGMGLKRLDKMQTDGSVLVDWYEKRPDYTTFYSDAKIAADLRWFPRNRVEGYGDGNRVRAARRHVDRCRCLFDGYVFGTKQNGAGRHTSRLHKRADEASIDALAIQFGEQIGRSVQANHQHGAERERAISLLQELRDRYTTMGDFEKAFCADHCLRDIEQYNTIQPPTVLEAQRLGIPIPRFA